MLDLRKILEQPEQFKNKLQNRGFEAKKIDELVALGAMRSKLITELGDFQAQRNATSKKIGLAKRNNEDTTTIMKEVTSIKESIDKLEEKTREVNEKVNKIILAIPNIPADITPIGKDEEDNEIINEYPNLGRGHVTNVKPHYEIAEELDLVDFERAVKISGTRFVAYKGLGARLVRALKDFMLDTHTEKNGYTEFVPPVIVNTKSLIGTGQLPKFADDLFKIEKEDKWLIPTAEVPLTNIYSGEILDLNKPKLITAYTLCFRSEAGSTGRDTRGLIRMHQFNKVELVKFVKQEDEEVEFAKLQENAEGILKALELPYQTLSLCTGDIGFSSKRTIDLEVWMPSENKYREISSVSNFGDYQARRAMIRYKDENKKTQYASTLNGSGIAIDRCVAAILENYQNNDGSITVPNVLVKYMGTNIIK
ncbi:serine--tRNA ligase [Mycoplasma marinum]|uniref:Serine--tRNA ligase n=1 Tax=Mycoplasma marinum TaxID=1937190 RepID=A0A4R0XUK2_9MOLU|nr:serine--tRNA ligase [Mycoplasma marinum]TCG11369.1 serine--tRNA ligase [Mycoplasma marinum]